LVDSIWRIFINRKILGRKIEKIKESQGSPEKIQETSRGKKKKKKKKFLILLKKKIILLKKRKKKY